MHDELQHATMTYRFFRGKTVPRPAGAFAV